MIEYLALRPLRFDKDYAIGDKIPASVISPGAIRRLESSGRIRAINPTDGSFNIMLIPSKNNVKTVRKRHEK